MYMVIEHTALHDWVEKYDSHWRGLIITDVFIQVIPWIYNLRLYKFHNFWSAYFWIVCVRMYLQMIVFEIHFLRKINLCHPCTSPKLTSVVTGFQYLTYSLPSPFRYGTRRFIRSTGCAQFLIYPGFQCCHMCCSWQ